MLEAREMRFSSEPCEDTGEWEKEETGVEGVAHIRWECGICEWNEQQARIDLM